MATDKKEKKVTETTTNTASEKASELVKNEDKLSINSESKSYENIDAVCDMMNKAKQDKAKDEEEKKKNAENKRKVEENNAAAAKKAADEKAKREEEERKVNQVKYMRKAKKRNATKMTFGVCLSSAVLSYVVAGILIYMIFTPHEWLFVGIMGIIGMIDTYIHTYLYRYIREEIYRK